MELWNRISGTVRVELTAADTERILAEAAGRGLILHQIQRTDGLKLSFSLARTELGALEEIVKKRSGEIRVLERGGLFYRMKTWGKRPVLLTVLAVLLGASLYLPERILFIQVSGNETVPTRLILETAQEFGLSFGASRRGVRSERIKNELLGAINALEWVGVNTSGSVATIEVRERQEEPEQAEGKICSLVASADGVIESVTIVRGDVLCAPGQVVRKGDILVSGLLDLGICTKALEAEGEIYARTLHESSAVLPAEKTVRLENQTQIKKFSLLVGKKRINLYSDSGILMPTCGKMTRINQLRLPGGFTLPLALIEETYTVCQTESQQRGQQEAEEALTAAMQRHLLQSMVAGSILQTRTRTEVSEQIWKTTASYECREMIARQDEGVYLQDYG